MPKGVYQGSVHCKKCEQRPSFRTISALRRHQWAMHKGAFERNHWTKEQREKFAATWEAKRSNLASGELVVHTGLEIPQPQKEMTAKELIERLKIQRGFLIDVVALVEGMVK